MEQLGSIALITLLPVAIFGTIASFAGAAGKRMSWVRAGERSLFAAFVLTTIAVGALTLQFFANDFSNSYVANHSNTELSLFYKATALWSGQEGSLLYWNWLLAIYGAAVLLVHRKRNRDLMPYVTGIILVSIIFFTILNTFVASPFRCLLYEFSGNIVPFMPDDGRGLNPLLQHPVMAIHPPTLYLGFVGFAVPFAFAMAALLVRSPGARWIRLTRRWTLLSWFFLTVGVLLGARWAYVELGWGGYWAWDPVENASLMPWLTGTAFLHSVMIQERKGMLKVWNVALVSITFFLCLFGTFLTRSGIVSSVHAFARSPIGNYIALFLIIGIILTIALVHTRRKYLKSDEQLDSMISRESSFLFNNLILLASCFAVLWGTIFPVISEAVQGEKISIGAPFFNKVNIPIGLFLLLLTGMGPLLAWRRTSWRGIRRNFTGPVAAGIAVVMALLLGGARDGYAIVCLGLCAFVLSGILVEIARGTRARMRQTGSSVVRAFGGMVARNTRRYGGYMVHMGVVFLFVGFAGAAFNEDVRNEVRVGGSIALGDYAVRVESIEQGMTPNYHFERAEVTLLKMGEPLRTLHPERRTYLASEQPSSEVEIYSTLREDIYVVYASHGPGGGAVIQVYHNPLVRWIWIGSIIMAIGTMVAFLPRRGGSR